jgi:hypothetical protein
MRLVDWETKERIMFWMKMIVKSILFLIELQMLYVPALIQSRVCLGEGGTLIVIEATPIGIWVLGIP